MKTSKTDWKSALGVKSPSLSWRDSGIAEDFLRGTDAALAEARIEGSENPLVEKLVSLICGDLERYPTFHGLHGLESWRRLPIEAKPLLTPPDLHSPCSTMTRLEPSKIGVDTSSWNDITDAVKKHMREQQAKYLASLNSRYITKAQAIGLGKLMVMGVCGDPGYSEVVAIPGDELLRLPDADVVPAKRAHYIPKAERGYPNRLAECSWCGYIVPYPGENYCPHCGAEMEDEDDG